MDVPSWTFLGFAAVAAVLFNLSKAPAWRQGVMLLANLAFLFSFVHQPLELVPYVGFLALGYGLIWGVSHNGAQAQPNRFVFIGAIALVLVSFFWLKKYTFLPSQTFLTSAYLMVGLSYVFFRVLHMVIDARDPKALGPVSVVGYLNYTLNFTALVSGPIQRYQDYTKMTTTAPAPLNEAVVGAALERIAVGVFKVMVVALILSLFQKQLLDALNLPGASGLSRMAAGAAVTALYPVYLWANFSGYVDVVLGVARFFRLELPENFNRPFSAPSFIEYWNRWHMSLSNWLKTYVYNPLLMTLMRRIKSPALMPYLGVFALFVTFFLIGLWHGRTSEFLIFGLLNGFGVAANQTYRILMAKRMGKKPFAALGKRPVYVMVCRGVTFTWLAFTLLWFWADWGQLGLMAQAMGPGGMVAGLGAMILTATLVLAAMEAVHGADILTRLKPLLASAQLRTAGVSLLLLSIYTVQMLMDSPAPAIIYKDF